MSIPKPPFWWAEDTQETAPLYETLRSVGLHLPVASAAIALANDLDERADHSTRGVMISRADARRAAAFLRHLADEDLSRWGA